MTELGYVPAYRRAILMSKVTLEAAVWVKDALTDAIAGAVRPRL